MVKNNRCLVDTQVFIWWMEDNRILNESVKKMIEDIDIVVWLSLVSIWEMVIKKGSGKLKLPGDWQTTLKKSKVEVLQINLEHVLRLDRLPWLHKDPFDRMLIAQALEEDLCLVTSDKQNWQYKVDCIKV